MGNGNRGVFSALESYIDMLINLIAFFVGYIFVVMIEEPKVDIFHPVTIAVIFGNLLVSSMTYHALNLYRQLRYMKPFRSIPEILKVNAVYFGALTAISAFLTRPSYKQFILFWILFSAIASTAFLSFKRHLIKVLFAIFRARQYHLRKVIIIGDNTTAAVDYVREVASNSQYGMVIIGYVGDKINAEDISVEKLGAFKDLAKILDKYRPTDVVFAIDAYDKRHLIKLVNMCDDRCIKVYFLPVIYGFFKNSRQIEQIGTVPLINIHSTPLDNPANAIIKRTFDIVGSILLIILTAPVMIAAAIGVRISSPGPIFFKQKRVGRMGHYFTMLKFRSMRVNRDSNKAWTTGTDPRKTKFGTFLRRTAIDELPQLFNVLAGSMSLVGPRPEIPVFVEHFKDIVPLYMIKHYVKPGITGLAQIKGFRGDTSIEARIHEDIAYIENWTLALDLYVLFKTPFKAINKNEKYVSPDGETEADTQENPIPESNTPEKKQDAPEAKETSDIAEAAPESEDSAKIEDKDTDETKKEETNE